MRSTSLIGIYALTVIGLVGALAWMTLYSLERSAWWDKRSQLAQKSYGLHLRLEADVYRLFKQHGDALLIGFQEGGPEEAVLKDRISDTIREIRDVISQEILMVGDEEIAELELLNEVEADIRTINAAIATLTVMNDPVDALVQIERVAALLDEKIDVQFTQKIEAALAEELEETQEVLAEAAAFRAWNKRFVYVMLAGGFAVLIGVIVSFHVQLRIPLLRLNAWVKRLGNHDYRYRSNLGGLREFTELNTVLSEMADALDTAEHAKIVQTKELEALVSEHIEALQQSMKGLQTAQQQRDQILEDLSHDLRPLLANIQHEVTVMTHTQGSGSDIDMQAINRIGEAADRLSGQINALLGVSGQDAKNQDGIKRHFAKSPSKEAVPDGARKFKPLKRS